MGDEVAKFRARWKKNLLFQSANLLSAQDQRKIIAISIVQICLGVLDLLGVLVIGLLGALSISKIQSSQPNSSLHLFLQWLGMTEASFKIQAAVLGTIAVTLFVGRSLTSIYFTRRIIYFFSERGARLSINLTSRLLSQSLLSIQSRTAQDTLFSLTRGIEIITIQVLATAVVLISDLSVLLIVGVGLFIVDVFTAAVTILIFTAIGFSLYYLMHSRAASLGIQNSSLIIRINEKVIELLDSYRESVVQNRREYYARKIGKLRFDLARTSAEYTFMPYLSKYILESTVVIGALAIGGMQFVLQDATQAFTNFAIFLAAGMRIAPAVLRVQQGCVHIRGSLGMAGPTLELMNELSDAPLLENVDDTLDVLHEGFEAKIQITSISFTYPGRDYPAITDMNFTIPEGSVVAFVGPSGAGKTTLVDILLGVLKPDLGCVTISGLPPLNAVAKWPGAISYVPQNILISNGTIRENVALGYPLEVASDELVMNALKKANLYDFVANLPEGIDTPVGDRGARISGGQRQRIGIARAMFTNPLLLVLDEATSSLDGEMEANISRDIYAIKGDTTVVMIAHRLSTIRHADTVFYMEKGKIISSGTFNEVRKVVPNFDRQANLI
jgi:ABC-type multidrug transport system fused ATPase/permease subunit